MIVNLAVEDDCSLAVVGYDWLIAGGEVDDLQAGRTHRAGCRLENALLVRAAMEQSGNSALDPAWAGTPFAVSKAGDSAHVRTILINLPTDPKVNERHATTQ